MQAISHFWEIFVEFSSASLGCNYELNWNNLLKKLSILYENSENKAALVFYRWKKKNENHHAEVLEDLC